MPADLFEEAPELRVACAFSRGKHNNMSLFYGDTSDSLNNRRRFLAEINVDYRKLVCAKQVHSNRVRHVKRIDRGRGALSYDNSFPDTDAFITSEKNIPLAVFTADCLSVFIFDLKNRSIGLAHAGWRSTKEAITVKTIELMQQMFNSQIDDLLIGFGPCLRSCCYEVKDEFEDIFPQSIFKKDGRYYLDIVDANKKQLASIGVKEDNITDSRLCTCCSNKEFFSYRRDGQHCGRMVSVFMLR